MSLTENNDCCWNCGLRSHHRKECPLPPLPGARIIKNALRKKNGPHINVKHNQRRANLGFIAPLDLIEKEVDGLLDVALEIEESLLTVSDKMNAIDTITEAKNMCDNVMQKLPKFYDRVRYVTAHYTESTKRLVNYNDQANIFEGKVDLLARIRTNIWEKSGKNAGLIKSIAAELENFSSTERSIVEAMKTWRQGLEIEESSVKNKFVQINNLIMKLNRSKHRLRCMCNDMDDLSNRFIDIYQKTQKWQQDLLQSQLKQENDILRKNIEMLQTWECPICCVTGNQRVAMFCGHQVCVKCIESIFTCPWCRRDKDPFIILY